MAQTESLTGASYHIRRMRSTEAATVACFHKEGIPAGVLAELGVAFMTPLYQSFNDSEVGFVFVAVDDQDEMIGFTCGTTNLDTIFREVLLHNWWWIWIRMLRMVFSMRMIRRIINVVRYPAKMQDTYPKAELLSTVVAEKARGTGVAGCLMNALFEEFAARGVMQIKVMVGAKLDRANAYYQKHGFKLAGSITSHGELSNIYVIDLSQRQAGPDA